MICMNFKFLNHRNHLLYTIRPPIIQKYKRRVKKVISQQINDWKKDFDRYWGERQKGH